MFWCWFIILNKKNTSVTFCGAEHVMTVGWDGRAQVHDLETTTPIGKIS